LAEYQGEMSAQGVTLAEAQKELQSARDRVSELHREIGSKDVEVTQESARVCMAHEDALAMLRHELHEEQEGQELFKTLKEGQLAKLQARVTEQEGVIEDLNKVVRDGKEVTSKKEHSLKEIQSLLDKKEVERLECLAAAMKRQEEERISWKTTHDKELSELLQQRDARSLETEKLHERVSEQQEQLETESRSLADMSKELIRVREEVGELQSQLQKKEIINTRETESLIRDHEQEASKLRSKHERETERTAATKEAHEIEISRLQIRLKDQQQQLETQNSNLIDTTREISEVREKMVQLQMNVKKKEIEAMQEASEANTAHQLALHTRQLELVRLSQTHEDEKVLLQRQVKTFEDRIVALEGAADSIKEEAASSTKEARRLKQEVVGLETEAETRETKRKKHASEKEDQAVSLLKINKELSVERERSRALEAELQELFMTTTRDLNMAKVSVQELETEVQQSTTAKCKLEVVLRELQVRMEGQKSEMRSKAEDLASRSEEGRQLKLRLDDEDKEMLDLYMKQGREVEVSIQKIRTQEQLLISKDDEIKSLSEASEGASLLVEKLKSLTLMNLQQTELIQSQNENLKEKEAEVSRKQRDLDQLRMLEESYTRDKVFDMNKVNKAEEESARLSNLLAESLEKTESERRARGASEAEVEAIRDSKKEIETTLRGEILILGKDYDLRVEQVQYEAVEEVNSLKREIEALEASWVASSKAAEALMEEVATMQNQLKEKDGVIVGLKEENHGDSEFVERLEGDILRLEGDILRLEEGKAEMKASFEQEKAEMKTSFEQEKAEMKTSFEQEKKDLEASADSTVALTTSLYMSKLAELQEELEETEGEANIAESAVQQWSKVVDEMSEGLVAVSKERDELRGEAKNRTKGHEKDVERLNDSLSAVNEIVLGKEEEVESLKSALMMMESNMKALEGSMKALEAGRLLERKKMLNEIEGHRETARKRSEALTQSKMASRIELKAAVREAERLRDMRYSVQCMKITAGNRWRNQMRSCVQYWRFQTIEGMKALMKMYQESALRAADDVLKMKSDLETNTVRVMKLSTERTKVEQEAAKFKAAADTLKAEGNRLKGEKTKLEADVDALEASKSTTQGVFIAEIAKLKADMKALNEETKLKADMKADMKARKNEERNSVKPDFEAREADKKRQIEEIVGLKKGMALHLMNKAVLSWIHGTLRGVMHHTRENLKQDRIALLHLELTDLAERKIKAEEEADEKRTRLQNRLKEEMERKAELDDAKMKTDSAHEHEKTQLEEEVDELLLSVSEKAAEVNAVKKEKADEVLRLNVLLRKQRMEISDLKSPKKKEVATGDESQVVSALKIELATQRDKVKQIEKERNMESSAANEEIGRLKVELIDLEEAHTKEAHTKEAHTKEAHTKEAHTKEANTKETAQMSEELERVRSELKEFEENASKTPQQPSGEVTELIKENHHLSHEVQNLQGANELLADAVREAKIESYSLKQVSMKKAKAYVSMSLALAIIHYQESQQSTISSMVANWTMENMTQKYLSQKEKTRSIYVAEAQKQLKQFESHMSNISAVEVSKVRQESEQAHKEAALQLMRRGVNGMVTHMVKSGLHRWKMAKNMSLRKLFDMHKRMVQQQQQQVWRGSNKEMVQASSAKVVLRTIMKVRNKLLEVENSRENLSRKVRFCLQRLRFKYQQVKRHQGSPGKLPSLTPGGGLLSPASPESVKKMPKMKKRVFKSSLFDVKNPWHQEVEIEEDYDEDFEDESDGEHAMDLVAKSRGPRPNTKDPDSSSSGAWLGGLI